MTLLLESDRPRFDRHELELGQFEARGPLLVLVGAWGPLFELLAGQCRLGGGSLRVAGRDAEGLARTGGVGLLRAGVPFPSTWTLLEVLRESGRLLGASKTFADEQAVHVAAQLHLSDFLGKKLSVLGPGQRRAVAVAAAMLGQPLALALEDPLGGLEPGDQALVALALERAVEFRPVLLSVSELLGNPERDDVLAGATELLILGRQGLAARGRHSELLGRASSYRVTVLRPVAPLLSRLVEAGYEARAVTGADTALLVVDPKGQGTEPLFSAALEVGVPIVELWPLGTSAAGSGDGDEH